MGIPITSEGIEIVETWDTLGMRGTGSHDVVLTDVFVSDAQVMSNRPWGTLDPPLMAIIENAFPVISAVYLGVAEGARDRALEAVRSSSKATDPTVQRLVGLLDYRTRVARWSLFGAIAEVGDDPAPSMDNVVRTMQAKRVGGRGVGGRVRSGPPDHGGRRLLPAGGHRAGGAGRPRRAVPPVHAGAHAAARRQGDAGSARRPDVTGARSLGRAHPPGPRLTG